MPDGFFTLNFMRDQGLNSSVYLSYESRDAEAHLEGTYRIIVAGVLIPGTRSSGMTLS